MIKSITVAVPKIKSTIAPILQLPMISTSSQLFRLLLYIYLSFLFFIFLLFTNVKIFKEQVYFL